MSAVDVRYRDGCLSSVVLTDANSVCVVDCRDSKNTSPFVSVEMADGDMRLSAYLPPELAEQLWAKLGKLFAAKAEDTAHHECEYAQKEEIDAGHSAHQCS